MTDGLSRLEVLAIVAGALAFCAFVWVGLAYVLATA